MRQHDGLCNREAKPEACGLVHVARIIAAHEGLQHGLLGGIGNAGAVVLDLDRRSFVGHRQTNGGFLAEPDCVLDEVGDAAVQIIGPDHRHRMIGAGVDHVVSHVRELVGDEL